MKRDAVYSLENEAWMGIRKSVDAVVNQEVAAGLRALGIAVRVESHGVEMAAYSREHLLHFSQAKKAIDHHLREAGHDPERAGGRAKEMANLVSRKSKRLVSLEAVQRMWSRRLERSGFPRFEAEDRRLQGADQRQALTPGQAIDSGLERASQGGKRLHSDHALLREAIYASDYRVSHAELRVEIASRLANGGLVHTEAGILPKEAAVAVANASRAGSERLAQTWLAAPEARAELAERLTRPSSGQPALSSMRVASVLDALTSASGAGRVELASGEVREVAAALLTHAREVGITGVLVSDDANPDSKSLTFPAAVSESALWDRDHLVVLTPSASSSPAAVNLVRAACTARGATTIELANSMALTAQPAATAALISRVATHAPDKQHKLAALGRLAARKGGQLQAVVRATTEGELAQEQGQAQSPTKLLIR